jgi:hypothetical protein
MSHLTAEARPVMLRGVGGRKAVAMKIVNGREIEKLLVPKSHLADN